MFSNCLEFRKYGIDIGLVFHWIKPCIFSKMIDEIDGAGPQTSL
jgi:hypothetical protein